MSDRPVNVTREKVVLPTYEPAPPERLPMFLDDRVYQGSSGRVYPLPFCDRIAGQPVPRTWEAIFVENDWLRVMILPALGGRIHRLVDKTTNTDVIYHQNVIKPALVGLAGPWISGGIEFNWPQHHRPSTFLPADAHVEHHPDGAATVWLSEHDPLARMKGMHGVCLHPDRAVLELKVRLHNRTPDPQTFLWWANAAVRVHEHYQSFFPPDVTVVADHARRALSSFPYCTGTYYGVDYAARARDGIPPAELPRQYLPPHCRQGQRPAPGRRSAAPGSPACRADDLTWYANIPVPTSFMCLDSRGDFFGGYDHAAQAGIVHVADHRIAPGKKQWTWGNHEFGYAWDRNLTDADERGEHAPYIELMAGVYTDNQPDFSWLQPGETKAWSQYWFPIRRIGPAHAATADLAASLNFTKTTARIGLAATRPFPRAAVSLLHRGKLLTTLAADLSPAAPFLETVHLPRGVKLTDLTLLVATADGRELLRHTPVVSVPPVPASPATPSRVGKKTATPAAATAVAAGAREPASIPPPPAAVTSVDELYLIGLHLEQYRHATRRPEDYWRAGYRRDADDYRCHLALGRWHLRRGEFVSAGKHLRASIARLTSRNPNPADGEPFYQLGRVLQLQAEAGPAGLAPDQPAAPAEILLDAAVDAYAKAAWNHAWRAPAHLALAEIACRRRHWTDALAHLDESLRHDTDQLRARALQAMVLQKLGRIDEAAALLHASLALDPLDWWARHQLGQPLACDNQVRLDLALDCSRAGLFSEGLAILADAVTATDGTAPLVEYTRAWLRHRLGDHRAATEHLAAAAAAPPDYCFPARVEEIALLEHAIAANPQDARAPYYLGNLLYDRRRHGAAIDHWQQTVRLDPGHAGAWRNLGLAWFNHTGSPAKSRRAYDRAFRAQPRDARLLFERDQLWKRLGVAPDRRLRELEKHAELVSTRDDLTLEYCALCNQVGRSAAALAILSVRRFQPWEGGEGLALREHVRTHLLLGRAALANDERVAARSHFCAALSAPENLGEANHLLANQSEIHFWIGEACAADGDLASAWDHWRIAAGYRGDFKQMTLRSHSEQSYYSARSLFRLDRESAGRTLLQELLAHARTLADAPATVDYFATSLPALLLFTDDLAARRQTTALFLEAQARWGLGQRPAARRLLAQVLRRDPAHAAARDFPLQ